MKKYDAMRLSGTILLAHLALCAAFLLLLIAASGSTSAFTFRSPYGLVLGLLFIGLPAFAFGWGLRSAKDPFDKKLCWNAAMVLYVLNAAAFLLAPEFGTGNVIAMWWGGADGSRARGTERICRAAVRPLSFRRRAARRRRAAVPDARPALRQTRGERNRKKYRRSRRGGGAHGR